MKKSRTGLSGFFQFRVLAALFLCAIGICLAKFSFSPAQFAKTIRAHGDVDRPRYMPVQGERGEELNRIEEEWYNRVTYPTGVFDPAWVRQAAVQDSVIERAIPAGIPFKGPVGIDKAAGVSPLALSSSGFTALGPAPLQMTGCSGCYDYSKTEGRVNSIAVDPTTTTNGSIVAYLGSDGGGVWKTTNCCSSSTTWTPTTDGPLLSTISIDSITIDPNNHNTVYAGTGDLNYGSFSMGSQGILKSTDAGAHWTMVGANVFGMAFPEAAGQFPQYNAVGKVRVDPNNSNNVVAGTKTGLYFSYDGGNNWAGPCTPDNFSTQRHDITGLELTNIGGITRILAAVGTRGIRHARAIQSQSERRERHLQRNDAGERLPDRFHADHHKREWLDWNERNQRCCMQHADWREHLCQLEYQQVRPNRHGRRAEQSELHLRAGPGD